MRVGRARWKRDGGERADLVLVADGVSVAVTWREPDGSVWWALMDTAGRRAASLREAKDAARRAAHAHALAVMRALEAM